MQFRILWNQKFELHKKGLPDPIAVERNDINIRENQGKMSSISRRMSGKMGDFGLEMAVATLYNHLSHLVSFYANRL